MNNAQLAGQLAVTFRCLAGTNFKGSSQQGTTVAAGTTFRQHWRGAWRYVQCTLYTSPVKVCRFDV